MALTTGASVQHSGEQNSMGPGLMILLLERLNGSEIVSSQCRSPNSAPEGPRVLMILIRVMNGSFADCMRNIAFDMLPWLSQCILIRHTMLLTYCSL